MSREIFEFSNSIDEQFDFKETAFEGIVEFFFRWFN